ncbi:carboxylic ester hydrolase isoform X1 [Leptinotarsa decemlineata]|uniref:carboxylic ester hydrolase isoform X1 n=1 Tax=Leptinotarsa decemlineata TaxID=7539 RepID=UPI003D3052C3
MILISVIQFFIPVALVTETHSISFLAKHKYNSTLQVLTRNGIVQGKQVYSDDGSSYIGYYGIPYAAPPLKSLRFRNPHPVKRWRGVLDATNFQSGCIETQIRLKGNILNVLGSEDCLYINVFTPVKKPSQDSYPTIFYIYGGAFVEGQSHIYNPDFLIQQDLIVVTFDFRSGLFGFLSTEDESSYGNYGLKDQHAALKWVNSNIKQFGGDPDQVTMTGHSSGSISAMYQMIYPKSWGLYNRVICLSGEVTAELGLQKFPRKTAFNVGLSLGIKTDNSTELVERLRQMDIEQLKQAQTKVVIAGSPNLLENGLLFTPVIEKVHNDAFISKPAIELLRNGEFARVPMITGMTTNEANSIAGFIHIIRFVLLLYEWSPGLFPNQLNIKSLIKRREAAKKIRRKYFKSGSFFEATDNELAQILSDLLYTRPITSSAIIMSEYIPVYFYIFGYETNYTKLYLKEGGFPVDISLNGVGHIEDLSFVFKYENQTLPPEGKELSKRITKIWSNFARYGNPTPTVDPFLYNITWPQISPDSKHVSHLRIDSNFSIGENFRMEYVDFLNQLKNVNK